MAAKNQNTTLQADGWTGVNFHHLLAFMIAFNKQAHTINVHDASSERKTAENLVMHLENAIRIVQTEYFAFLVAIVTDASGECRKARRILALKYPEIVFLDCYAHQINLVVGDYFKSKASVLEYADCATELIAWLRNKTQVLALLQEVQVTLGDTAVKAVIRAVLTRWTAHYQAYSRLLDLRPVLVMVAATDECRSERERCLVAGDAKAKKKATAMVTLIRNDTFWRALLRMKSDLEPLAIAANITQAAFCRLDTVLLTFGFLVMQYQKMMDADNLTASTSIIASLEKRWAAADQDIFIATVIVNPFFRADPFGRHTRFVVSGIIDLLERLYTRFFKEEPPFSFSTELCNYLTAEGQYSALRATCIRHMAAAEGQGGPPDPLEVYRDLSFSSEPHSPFHRLAARLLSICANSATCERLFSVFGNTLTKLRNQMGTSTLSSIAELKMHVRNEHQLNSTKIWMKRMFVARSTTIPPNESSILPTLAHPPSPQSPASDETNEENEDLNHARPVGSSFRDLVSTHGSVPIEDDEPCVHSQEGKLTLSQLFNFGNDHWIKSYEKHTRKSFDEELALYDLLNEDAATGNGMEVDVDETTAEILLG